MSGWFTNLIVTLLVFFVKRLEDWGFAWWNTHEAELETEHQATHDENQLAQAQTPEEKQDVATQINQDTFH